MSLLGAAASVLAEVRRHGWFGCLVGGLAVSVHCDPRFTLDVDLAVAVGGDSDTEELTRSLTTLGFRPSMLVEQKATGRLAMVRLADVAGVDVDILVASSGIETEIVTAAEPLEVVPGLTIPVARVGHLIAMKLLSVADGRETDWADLRNLAAVADDQEWLRASEAVELIVFRGYGRGRDLVADLARLKSGGRLR